MRFLQDRLVFGIIHFFAGVLHGCDQRAFCVRLWRGGFLLLRGQNSCSGFPYRNHRQNFVLGFAFFPCVAFQLLPSQILDDLTGCHKVQSSDIGNDGRFIVNEVLFEHRQSPAQDEVIDFLLVRIQFRDPDLIGHFFRRDDGIMLLHFGIIDVFFTWSQVRLVDGMT